MRHAARKLLPAVKWHGGKSYLAREIIALFPRHRVYIEPFAGGASVLLNKPPAAVEVLGDVNPWLMAFYRILRDRTDELVAALEGLTYCEEGFERAKIGGASGPLQAAIDGLVRNRWSRGGLGKDFAWSDRLRGGQPGDVNGWESTVKRLPAIAERLRDVRLVDTPAVETIRRYDAPDALIYADPPYLHATRTHRKAYAYEMTEADHRELLDVLSGCQGAVYLSGYPSALYDGMLGGWERVEIDMPNHSGQGKAKQRRTEVVWSKPSCKAVRVAVQGTLFA